MGRVISDLSWPAGGSDLGISLPAGGSDLGMSQPPGGSDLGMSQPIPPGSLTLDPRFSFWSRAESGLHVRFK